MRLNFRQKITQAWHQGHWALWLLYPLSCLFRVVIWVRRKIYELFSTTVELPVIIVGNISVGGTGKTPFVIYLAQALQNRGHHPGIVTRGYGGQLSSSKPYLIQPEHTATQVGDEALLLAQKTNVPVVISTNRKAAVQYLEQNTACNVVISDDGLQQYGLPRCCEIVMIDGERGMGNGLCLPAGPLREPVSRLQQVDWVISTGETTKKWHDKQLSVQIEPVHFCHVTEQTIVPLDHFQGRTVHAVAGIGNPERFFSVLRQLGITCLCHVFPDHAHYQPENFSFAGELPVVMTEKDAVKCTTFPLENAWTLNVKVHMAQDQEAILLSDIISKLQE